MLRPSFALLEQHPVRLLTAREADRLGNGLADICRVRAVAERRYDRDTGVVAVGLISIDDTGAGVVARRVATASGAEARGEDRPASRVDRRTLQPVGRPPCADRHYTAQ